MGLRQAQNITQVEIWVRKTGWQLNSPKEQVGNSRQPTFGSNLELLLSVQSLSWVLSYPKIKHSQPV